MGLHYTQYSYVYIEETIMFGKYRLHEYGRNNHTVFNRSSHQVMPYTKKIIYSLN
jgi:hypothetical protein